MMKEKKKLACKREDLKGKDEGQNVVWQFLCEEKDLEDF